MNTAEKWHGTTIVLLRKGGETIVAGDGQVSLGNTDICVFTNNNVTMEKI